MRVSLAAILIAAATCGAALAQDAPKTAIETIRDAKVPQATLDLAMKLVKLSGTSRPFNVILPNVADETKNLFIKANPQMQLGVISIVDRLALTLVPRRADLDKALARLWISGFTVEEMQELVTFYESDVGKKFAETHPKLLSVEMATAQQWGLAVGRELSEKVAIELRTAVAADQQASQSDIAGPAVTAPAAPASEAAAPTP